jgi:UDP-glucose 4-epimerase
LAEGHVKALEKLDEMKKKDDNGAKIYNLGTGVGYSVLDVVHSFERASGITIPYEIKPRRAGDIATCYADSSKAKKELHWEAKKDMNQMCEDSWRWQSQNPEGLSD